MSNQEAQTVSKETERQAHWVWHTLGRVLGVACAVVLTVMMLLTGADVIARYVFNAPIKGAFELTEILLVCFVFLAMPLAMYANAHVEVELWEPKNKIGERLRIAFGGVAALIVFCGLAWQLFDHGVRLGRYGSVSNSLEIPLSIVAWIAAFGCALGALLALRHIIKGFKS